MIKQTPSIAIACYSATPEKQREADKLAESLKLPLVNDTEAADLLLTFTDDRLQLSFASSRLQPMYVDFLSPHMTYRRLKGGGKGQLIAKAIGLKNHPAPTIIDATAGLGTDGFILAGLGCTITMIERSPIICALLTDGLKRLDAIDIQPPLNLSLIHTDAIIYLNALRDEASFPDIIYLDPMFPAKTNNALAKKAMRILRTLVGDDTDAEILFHIARRCAKKRVVVKRHALAPTLGNQPPDLVFKGKSCRFDVYLRKNTRNEAYDDHPRP